MTTHNTREGKPDFHMIALTKSECAKDAGELTVVRLGYVTQLLEEVYATLHQELQKAREEERGRVKALVMAKSAIFDSFIHDTISGRDELNDLLSAIDQSEIDHLTSDN